ncbi:MAG: Ig-like domain-containing protein [Bacteroidetes bacterium]|nr:Ig-like domain-containing protein [Bacteroidota bacterium]MBU1720265.1 Ig-like domain-containing protein [Bacteroidota bacterium]
MRLGKLFFVVIMAFVNFPSLGQVTLYSEDFSTNTGKGQDGTTYDMSGVTNWTIDVANGTFASGDWFKVTGGYFESYDTDAAVGSPVAWYSSVVSISGYSDVVVSLDLGRYYSNSGSGCKAYYSIDGGSYTEFGSVVNSTGAPDGGFTNYSATGITGSTIQIKVTHWGTSSTPYYRHDNVLVQGTPAGCTSPSTQASGIGYANVDCSSLDLSWTRGDGDNVLVVAKAGGAPTDPENGTSYSADAAYGSGDACGGGYVVYNGSGTSVSLSNLTPGTTYNFGVWEYNNADVCYNTDELTGSQATSGTAPATQASALLKTNVTSCKMDLSWTRGSGDGVMIIARGGAAPTDPTNGTTYTADAEYGEGEACGGGYVVYDGAGTSMTLTGLTRSITYNFALYEYYNTCGTITYNLVQLTGSQATLANPVTQASAGSCSNEACTSMDVSWTRGNGDKVLVIARTGANTDPTQGTSYTADAVFGSGTAIGATGYVVYDGTGTTVTVTGLSPNTTYYFDIYEYYSPCSAYNVAQITPSSSTLGTPPATQASALVKSNITSCDMDLSWTRGNGDKVMVVAKAGSAPTDPTQGVAYNANNNYGDGDACGGGFVIYDGTGTGMTFSGLSPSTTYNFALYEYSTTCTVPVYNMTQLTGSQASAAAASVSSVTSTNANGTYIVDDVITVTVTFSQIVTVTGTPRILLETGTTDRYANYTGGSGTVTLSFEYTVQNGDESSDLQYTSTSALELNGGTISFGSCPVTLTLPGLASGSSLGGSKAIVIDGVLPYVTVYYPADNSSDFPGIANLVLTFNENIEAGTAGNFVIYNDDASVFETIPYDDSQITYSSNTITINPGSDLIAGNAYYVQISATAVVDANGNPYAGISDETTWNFSARVPQTYYVDDDSDTDDAFTVGSANGSNAAAGTSAEPWATLTYAVSQALPGDVIYVDAGTYSPSLGAYVCPEELTISQQGLQIIGAGTVLTRFDDEHNGTTGYYFGKVTGSDIKMSNFTVERYGVDVGSVGVIQIGDGTATVTGLEFNNVQFNVNAHGQSGASLNIKVVANTSVTFNGGGGTCNTEESFGGAFRITGANINATFNNYSFLGNQNNTDGVGLLMGGATQTVTIRNSIFADNEASADHNGADIAISAGTLNIYDCLFDNSISNLSAGTMVGGAVKITGGAVHITRSIFTNHSATGGCRGAAIGNSGGTVTIDSCYFSGNSANKADDVHNASGSITAYNCTWSEVGQTGGSFTIENSGDPSVFEGTVTKTNTTAPSYTADPSLPAYTGDCSSGIILLPVELTYFSGRCNGTAISLTWKTGSEFNNKEFVIFRSTDGVIFTAIGVVEGVGNSNTTQTYSFEDKDYTSGINYYRLRQFDFNGEYEDLFVIGVEGDCNPDDFEWVSIGYSSSDRVIRIESLNDTEGNVNVDLFDITGNVVVQGQTGLFYTGEAIQFDTRQLARGVYFVRVMTPGIQRVEKVLVY